MYRDASRHHVQAPRPLRPLVEMLYVAALCVASPVIFVFNGWYEIYARILRSQAPPALCGAELDALFTRLTTDFPVRLVSYTDKVFTMASLVVLTFRNGDAVSFDALASRALARQAHLCAAAGKAKIKEHIIAPDGLLMVFSFFATLIESIVLALFSKVIALLFAGTFVVTLIALISAQSIAEEQKR